jgi:hypothetical protein
MCKGEIKSLFSIISFPEENSQVRLPDPEMHWISAKEL